ncbi:MAG: glycosyltransferase family 4 protein [Desulfomonile tiedjei]|uniref:Glycosyltransferase family 4 protein n=1 Tax=Desulfomonile tiedjei TaxID=2358 RepID=A0A9D6VAR5_9BACT|nr:glycosyltransferase family 4 protein [Desulfomonile tiedjei]
MKSGGPLRIGMLTNSVYSRDARVRRYSEFLAEEGHQVDIICLDSENSLPQSSSPHVSVYCVPMTRVRAEGAGLVKNWFSLFAHMFFLFSKLQIKRRYDLVHVHNMPDFLVFCALISRVRGCPIVLNVHDPVPELARSKLALPTDSVLVRVLSFLESISIGFSSHVITPTRTFRDALVSRGIPDEKITIITNAADSRFFSPNGDEPDSAKRNSGFTLLYVGTVAARYGLDVVIRALPGLRDSIPGLKFRIVPKIRQEGVALDRCLALADELGVRDLLQVDDPLPLEKMAGIMRQADIGVYPARVDCHMDIALSLKIPEMAMIGLPIIATRLTILEELFGNDSIAFVPPEDPAAFASKVLELYRSPELRQKLARKAAAKSETLAWENHCEIYRNLLEGLLQRPLHG